MGPFSAIVCLAFFGLVLFDFSQHMRAEQKAQIPPLAAGLGAQGSARADLAVGDG